MKYADILKQPEKDIVPTLQNNSLEETAKIIKKMPNGQRANFENFWNAMKKAFADQPPQKLIKIIRLVN